MNGWRRDYFQYPTYEPGIPRRWIFLRLRLPHHNHFTESKSWIVRRVTSIAWEEEGATNVPDLITGASENIFSIAKNILFTFETEIPKW